MKRCYQTYHHEGPSKNNLKEKELGFSSEDEVRYHDRYLQQSELSGWTVTLILGNNQPSRKLSYITISQTGDGDKLVVPTLHTWAYEPPQGLQES